MLLAALSLFILYSPSAQPLRNVVFDGYQRLVPLERTQQPVAIVVIDGDALATFGQWPWPRTRMAELITRISEHEPAAIGMDLLFSEPDRFSPAAIAGEIPLLPSNLAQALASIQSAKGVQFADAFVAARERGSAVHDPISVKDGHFTRERNRAGGLEGGMTNGEDILVDVAFKPISTLMKPLASADLRTGAPSPAHVERSDVCVVPAAGVVAEAMLAFVLADALLEKFGADNADDLVAAVDRYRARLTPIDQRR